eukprot:CAMPEP_0176349934 /NCGR_PEP_ID=MMETSP0126-20121128/9068_1 /TAXON_ID=141414 ORGANISM="Strombidinopsis acuminatum, Strain SPMC142" /NCGR_SAMPLE_ID=MMETSP0126 /ASSEMBLY_ACC=CAM_ASM_000229 /LENGTH=66 /DNA_ID=CAMNT_0017699635 /DNA_START=987 /DNA_END=1187 /DNA_ORIENTATION=+
MPVFEPNDYFWANHWDDTKEEKWEAYARVVRQLMLKKGDFEDYSSVKMEDKLMLKSLMKGSQTEQF